MHDGWGGLLYAKGYSCLSYREQEGRFVNGFVGKVEFGSWCVQDVNGMVNWATGFESIGMICTYEEESVVVNEVVG